nr:leucine-rich repeat protein [Saccharofermentans sp.]
EGCSNLESVNIAGTVTKIGNYAFSDCPKLKSAVLDENLYRSSSGIFFGCTGVQVSYISNYPILIYGGTSDVSKACAGTIVTLKAYDEADGKVFDQWIINRGEIELTIVDEKTATFVMPASLVEITASFKDKDPLNNTLTVKGRNAKLKAKKLKKKSQKISRAKVMTIRNPQGRLTYKLLSVSKSRYKKYFKVNARNGVVTVKQKLKKGTYTVRCRVTASGNADYKGVSRIVSFKITVK